jgi:hypothetical protein
MGVGAIDQLGVDLDEAWRARDYEPGCFPDLCVERLSAAAIHRAITPAEILAWVLCGSLPEQFDQLSRFGQPPITVFRARRFIIDTLFWLDGTTNIHDHGFSGAFQVLSGSSIETTFSFTPGHDIDGHLAFGTLHLHDAALRRTGDIRTIVPGASYIHGLFHLDRPSVTLLIRTLQEPILRYPLQYQPSGIAWNPFFKDPILERILEVVQLLDRSDDSSFDRIVGDLVAHSDAYTVFSILRRCVDIPDQRRLDALLSCVHDHEAAKVFAAWLTEERTLRFLRKSRGVIHETDLRFFLAVLLNSHRGDHSLGLVSSFVGGQGDAAGHVATWLRRLSKISMRLQVGGSPWEPNVLGLPEFEAGFEEAVADALAKRERVFTPAERAFLERLRALPHLAPLFRG